VRVYFISWLGKHAASDDIIELGLKLDSRGRVWKEGGAGKDIKDITGIFLSYCHYNIRGEKEEEKDGKKTNTISKIFSCPLSVFSKDILAATFFFLSSSGQILVSSFQELMIL
jgi:hypothetical protein